MEGNFVADVRLDDSDEVLQLPIVKSRVKKLLQGAVKKIALLGTPVIPSSDDSLEVFLHTAGRFFGKDPQKWEQVGDTKIEVSEENGKRTIKSTGVFSGTELHLLVETPYYDDRLPIREDKPELNFNEKRRHIRTDEEWQELINEQPWTASKRRQMLTAYMQAKVEADDGELAEEGAQGFWELAINKDHHLDIRMDRLAALLGKLNSPNIQVATATAAAIWGLATTAPSRKSLADLDAVSLLLSAVKRTVKMQVVPEPEPGKQLEDGAVTEKMRDKFQHHVLGSLALMLIDRNCRRPYLTQEPDFSTLFMLCRNLDGYIPATAAIRRETAAKTLTSIIQRDADARKSLITSGALKQVLTLLVPEGPSGMLIQFCMASLLATLVLDEEAMEVIQDRGEAPTMFEACLILLRSTLDKLKEVVDSEANRNSDDDTPLPQDDYDVELGVRLAEAASQAMWGSAHYCVLMDPIQVRMEHVVALGEMGMDCYNITQLPLSRVCHCVVATVSTLAASPDAAELIMNSPDDIALMMLMTLVEVFESENFERASHVKAAACAGVAFLACHPIGAEGDECMNGPYRKKLLSLGAFGALLRAALSSVLDHECDRIIQQAAAIGVMYLSTMAGALDPAELAMYAALLTNSDNSEMIEFLMAGMWILLRNGDNRRVLGTSFNPSPANQVAKNMMSKLNDAITLHEIHDKAQEQSARIKQMLEGGSGDANEGADSAQDEGGEAAESRQGYVEDEATGPETGSRQPEPSQRQSSTQAHGDSGLEGVEAEQSYLEERRNSGRHASSSNLQDDAMRGHYDPAGAGSHSGRSSPKSGNRSLNHSRSSKVRSEEAAAMKKKMEELGSKFDKELKEDWGLETLVTVGESWLPAMVEQDQVGEANDIPVLKLFEFLVASICLFMIEDDTEPEKRDLDLFQLSAPKGARSKTWWTVDAQAPQPTPVVDANTERALTILLQIVQMRLPAAWKSLQLGVLTLWNGCARNASMERHVVEHGVCIHLLAIVNNPMWPPTLRDIAGGCLEFFTERHSNLYMYGLGQLPEGAEYALPHPPSDGLVPYMDSMITLINSQVPILEYRGCHGLARITFSCPYGAPSEKEFLKEAKAVGAALGGLDALVTLIKRLNKRYQDLLSGNTSLLGRSVSTKPKGDGTEEAALYERDMSTKEAQQDIYFLAFASLVNLSVLKANQVPLAKKGLLVLLGTSTFLYGRCASSPRPSPREQQLLHVCSAVIQNISLHPKNRTRLYKAELKGGVALDKLIEGATDLPQELEQTAAMLPPLSPSRSRSPSKSIPKLSNNGAVLNNTLDSELVSVVRPKVVFPPLMDRAGDTTISERSKSMSARPSVSGGHGMAISSAPGSVRGSSSPRFDEPPGSPNRGMDVHDSRSRFMNWMDNTFSELEPGANITPAFIKPAKEDIGAKKSYRKALWDESGDWLPNEVESSKALNRLLCRPLNHLWQDNPEARSRMGKARWEPAISEYREPKTSMNLTRPAQKLLCTQPPQDAEATLQTAAMQLMSTGRLAAEDGNEVTLPLDTVAIDRPNTAQRERGRIGLTVLQPHPYHSQTGSAPQSPQASPGIDSRGSMSLPASPSPASKVPPVALNVYLGPKRARQVISFEDRIIVDTDNCRPMLTVFEHIEGSKVCEGLFPAYIMPNGRQAYMYYTGGQLLDEVAVDPVVPPPRPSTVPQALQQTMPLANVLNLIAKPPGSAPPFIPYKPVPRLVPLPPFHSLTVKRPQWLSQREFGDLREDNLQLIIQARRIIKTQTSTKVEAVEVLMQEEREPWTLPNSIFKPRVKESDAKAFFDNGQVEEKMFERDWQRACSKEKFMSMLTRENKANKEGKEDRVMLKEVHDVLLKYYQQIYGAFVYYAAAGSGDPYHMSLNAFTSFLDDCQVVDPESNYVKRSDCDTIFIVCNFQPDKKSAEAQVNVENAMMRYEFLEALVRLALAKYGKGQVTDDVAMAVTMLLENQLLPNLPPGARVVSNHFRTDRFYNEEADLLCKKHVVMLKTIYSRYRLKPTGGGLRPKVLKLDGWLQLMSDAHFVDSQFTLQDATLAFLWSRMYTIDEIKDYARYTCLSFIDFLEAVGRVADMKSLPTASDLDIAGYDNILDWAIAKERAEGDPNTDGLQEVFRPRPSAGFETPKNRPLYVKLELTLDLLFRRLYYDPTQSDNTFNYDNLMKLVKKIDKDLGP